ncbi:MAG: DUF5681 domain-containing protein [Thermodesulfobacteriota bacterium]
MVAEKTGRKQAGQFKKGESGNANGRPRGSRNKTTMAALALLEGEAEALTRKAVEAALGGDMQALRLCLERIAPPAKDRPISLKLPKLKGVADLPKLTAAILDAVAAGKIGPTEAATVKGQRY